MHIADIYHVYHACISGKMHCMDDASIWNLKPL